MTQTSYETRKAAYDARLAALLPLRVARLKALRKLPKPELLALVGQHCRVHGHSLASSKTDLAYAVLDGELPAPREPRRPI